jgi:hypothetical protein
MAFSEEYYVHLNGEQKGPYTLPQLMGLYAKGFIPEETLYWMDGFDQWQPVADLCGPSLRVWRKKSTKGRAFLFAGALLAILLTAFFGPLVRDGWRETNQRRFTPEAAYWKARGFVREEVQKQRSNLAFERFNSALVTLTGGTNAEVELPCTLFPPDGSAKSCFWHVDLRFDPATAQWRLVSEGQKAATLALQK